MLIENKKLLRMFYFACGLATFLTFKESETVKAFMLLVSSLEYYHLPVLTNTF